MPQASEELRQLMMIRFGGLGDGGPAEYLKERGFQLNPHSWTWSLAEDRELTENELDAIQFLIEEWDYGSFVRNHH